jgi:hypothetical protein
MPDPMAGFPPRFLRTPDASRTVGVDELGGGVPGLLNATDI